MKKFIKSRLFSFLLGALIFSTIGVYAGAMLNSQEIAFKPSNNKWQVTSVEGALNDLYSNAGTNYAEYTGTTSVIPTYSDITLNTQDKLLKNNIIISGIPSTYKNLTTTTTVTAADLATGKTAYNNVGELITGTAIVGSNCISGTYNHIANTQWNIELGFVPYKLSMLQKIGTVTYSVYMNKDINNTIYNSYTGTNGQNNINNVSSNFEITSSIKTNFASNHSWYTSNYSISYMACK